MVICLYLDAITYVPHCRSAGVRARRLSLTTLSAFDRWRKHEPRLFFTIGREGVIGSIIILAPRRSLTTCSTSTGGGKYAVVKVRAISSGQTTDTTHAFVNNPCVIYSTRG